MANPNDLHSEWEEKHWQKIIDDEGVEAAIKKADRLMNSPTSAASWVINNHLNIKKKTALERQEKRDNKALEIAQEAQRQAEKSYHQSWIAIGIAGVAALVTIAIALLGNG